jgi:glutamyl-tRNA reductase
MLLLTVGCSFRNTPVDMRERLAFDNALLGRALDELGQRYGCEAVILSTCNRVELYIARGDGGDTSSGPDAELLAEFLAEIHGLPVADIRPYLYHHASADSVRHLFRVVASLDSMIVGEAQIAGQVKRAYELAQQRGAVGPLLHAVFQHARRTGRRVRAETGLARGNVSVSSAAVAYVREVFDHFGDKTILVLGAGKMGELTLKQLRQLQPQRILVANRSTERAEAVARSCGGSAVQWDQLDDVLTQADIVLSTTGAPEPIVTRRRWNAVLAQRTSGRPVVILDIAVPRDFDARIHDGDRTFLFNIDDLHRMRQETLRDRLQHVGPAEAIVEQEQKRFLSEWDRKKHGPIIARLTQDFEAKRLQIVEQLMARLNGKLTDADRAQIEGAFRLLQNQLLHGPISALAAEPSSERRHTLLEALRKLFGLEET